MFTYSDIRPSYEVGDARKAVLDPEIIHFSGRIKPCDPRCVNPLAGWYWYYRNTTPWRESLAQQIRKSIRARVRASLSPTQRRLVPTGRRLVLSAGCRTVSLIWRAIEPLFERWTSQRTASSAASVVNDGFAPSLRVAASSVERLPGGSSS